MTTKMDNEHQEYLMSREETKGLEKTADEMFEELGYEKKTYDSEENKKYHAEGIQYIKYDGLKNKQDELERCGIYGEQFIEFLTYHKNIEAYSIRTFRDGSKTKPSSCFLKIGEIKAINKKIKELGWEE